MPRRQPITQDEFNRLLAGLSDDPEEAGRRYEDIRHSLIKLFTWRGCTDAEGLADEVFDRAAARLSESGRAYVGDPAHYCYGIARKLFHEYRRRMKSHAPLDEVAGMTAPAHEVAEDDSELEHECLGLCVGKLDAESRELIMAYYALEKRDKIDARKALAERFGISINNLRVRLYRIRAGLETCIRECKEKGRRREMN
jgi:DNA-directed RNA polymerase specialized sigma24 family protein